MHREIIAILRGVRTNEVYAIGETLVEAGITTIEVPLNSPEPYKSIERLARHLEGQARIGAGTVLSPEQVAAVADAGGTLVVSPDTVPEVIIETKARGMMSYPGVMTPSECFTALRSGADGLKFFPAFLVGTKGINALKAVLPADVKTYAVGGVEPDNVADWIDAGITGFGVGSGIYRAGDGAETIERRARAFVTAYDQLVQPH